MSPLCRSQADSGSVSGRNGCWALRGTLHCDCLSNQQVFFSDTLTCMNKRAAHPEDHFLCGSGKWCVFVRRALSSQQLTLASVMVVDMPGLRNPRHSAQERGAGWSELCHNYLQERLLEHCHTHTFTHTLERYAQVSTSLSPTQAHFQTNEVTFGRQERIPVELENPEDSPAEVVSAIDQPPPQVAGSEQGARARHLQNDARKSHWAHLSCESHRVCHQLSSVCP